MYGVLIINRHEFKYPSFAVDILLKYLSSNSIMCDIIQNNILHVVNVAVGLFLSEVALLWNFMPRFGNL